MFRTLNGFLLIVVAIVALKFALPAEASDLASQILIKVLTLIRDLLAQVTL